MLHKFTADQIRKIRFTVFLNEPLAEALTEMPRKKRNAFINENLDRAIEREKLMSHLEAFKAKKTHFQKGQTFVQKIRKKWRL